MIYGWDPRKAARNLSKHGVSFAEAASVFLDPLARTYRDPDHSEREQRYLTIGRSARHRVVIVAHLDHNDLIRIISARVATKREGHDYAEEG